MTERHDTDPSLLGRVLSIFECFPPHGDGLSLSEIAKRTGLPKATVHRIAGDLVSHRLLMRDAYLYTPALRLFELALRSTDHGVVRDAALPHMAMLYATTRSVVHLAVLDEDEIVYLERICDPSMRRLPTGAGARFAAHATALGKALLAFSDQPVRSRVLGHQLTRVTPYTIFDPAKLTQEVHRVRDTGSASERDEAVVGISCLASPVFAHGNLVAALSLSGRSGVLNIPGASIAVRHTSHAISTELSRMGRHWHDSGCREPLPQRRQPT